MWLRPMQSVRVLGCQGSGFLPHMASKITLDTSIPLTYQEKRIRAVHASFSTRPGNGVCRFATHISLAGTQSHGQTKVQGRLGNLTSCAQGEWYSEVSPSSASAPTPKKMAPSRLSADLSPESPVIPCPSGLDCGSLRSSKPNWREVLCSHPCTMLTQGQKNHNNKSHSEKRMGNAAIVKGLGEVPLLKIRIISCGRNSLVLRPWPHLQQVLVCFPQELRSSWLTARTGLGTGGCLKAWERVHGF